MPSIDQIVAQIRTAIYGRDVRENIALGIEQSYADNVKKSDIADNLTTNDAKKVLSAKQGKTLNNTKVNKAGDTMSDNLTIDKPSGSTNVTLHNSTNELRTAFSIGQDTTTHGIYSYGYVDENGTYHSSLADGKWLISRDKNNVVKVNGRATENVLTSDAQMKTGGNWWEAPADKLPHYFKYEGNNTTTYKLPIANCIIMVIKESVRRGVAFAIRWSNTANQMWIARLHDDTGSNTFSSWEEITGKVNGKQGALLTNRYNPLTSETGYFCYGTTPNNLPSQGLPTDRTTYGTVFGDCSGSYKSMFYLSVLGDLYTWRTNGTAEWVQLALKSNSVQKTGDTMSDNLTISKASGSTNLTLINSTNGLRTAFSIGNDATTHGIFSYGYVDDNGTYHSDGKWLIYRYKDNIVRLNGRASENILKTDIADNLITNDATKVLSAKQGKVLNDQIGNSANAVETNIHNLLDDGVTWVDGKYLDGDGTIGNSANMRYSSLIEFTHPNDYVVTFTALNELHNFRILGYDKNGNFRRQLRAIAAADQELNGVYSTSFAAGDCKYVRISICSFYTVHLAQTIDDKDLCVKYQNNVDTFALSERKNLLEGVGWTEYAMIGSNGAIDTTSEKAPYCRYSDLISVPSNKRYYLSSIVKVERTPGDIYIDGYNSSNTWVKRLRTIPADEQTAGSVSIESFYVPEGIASIRISLRTYHFACLSVSNDIDETVMESLYDKSTMPWVVGGINYVSGATNTNTERIRPDGWGDLGADFIRGENVKISLFIYDRDQTFVGVWDGSKLVSGVMAWFDFINMREVHKALDSLYPNFLYKMTARVPGSTTPSASDGSKVYFYTRKIQYASVGSYLTWAVIGASSENGWFGGQDNPDYAWPVILARKIGNTVTNYSKGGQKLKTFITDTSSAGLARLESDSAKELYVITLGGNDASTSSYAIGTIADITGHRSGQPYADTVYGDYGQIIDRIKAHAPNAKLILTTPPGSNYNARHLAVDNAVREIAAYYGIPYIEWERDPFMSSNVYTRNLASNHPTKILYSGKAMAFERLFSECVAKNIEYFS